MNPRFNTALGPSSITRQAKPPSRFEGVTSRVFPLKANMYRMRKFCDLYLNVAPDIAHFQPYLPYVFLMVLDYGRMSSEVANMGWVSQREVAFALPLEWYDPRKQNRFVDFAVVSPFIYVDDETSLSTGRQVYGWPKVKVWADQQVNPWVYDPQSFQHLLQLSAMVMPEMYRGERQQPKVLLEVRQEVAPAFSFPPDPSQASNPFSVIPDALAGYFGLMGSWVEMMTGAPQLGYDGAPLDPISRFARMGEAGVAALGENPALNNITLKQFRDSQAPDEICFQALVQSQIKVERFNSIGAIGDSNLALGDPTGGIRVLVHRYAAQPIIESLGIEVAHETRFDGGSVATLRPMFPFWVNVDLEYGLGYPICWRTRQSAWNAAETNVADRIELRSDDPGDPRQQEPREQQEEKGHPFNTTLGGALQGVTGPFDFPNVTMRVLPLLADPERLSEFVAEYLYSEGDEKLEAYRFEAWGSYVYLVATNYEEMSSATNNIGWWADRELVFFVPVKCYDKEGKLLSMGLVPALPFVNTSTAAITGSEVRGQPTQRAILERPHDVWMDDDGPSEATDQSLLVCRTTVVPALSMGQKQELRTLVEISHCDALPPDDERWRMIGAGWGRRLLDEHRRLVRMKKEAQAQEVTREDGAVSNHYDVARAMSLELLARGEPVNQFSLKQFRDSEDPDLACYQSVIRLPRWIEDIYDIREIEEQLHVQIHQHASLPIVKLLGLIPKWSVVTGEAKVDILQPMRPFWIKASLHEGLGWNLRWRAGSSQWHSDTPPPFRQQGFGYFTEEGSTDVGFGILHGLGTDPDEYNNPIRRQHLMNTTRDWIDAAAPEHHFTRNEGATALGEIEPQVLLNAMLSAEWQHWGSPRWFRRVHRHQSDLDIKSDLTFRTDSVGGPRERNRFFRPLTTPGSDGWMTNDGAWFSEDDPPPWSS